MKKLILITLFVLTSCSSAIKQVGEKRAALAEDANVTIHYKTPEFDYTVVCEIEYEDEESGTLRSAYSEALQKYARECGATDIIFDYYDGLSPRGKNKVLVKAVGIIAKNP